MTSSHLIILNTSLVTLSRCALFYACYHYLLRTVFHDLQALASSAAGPDADSDIELESLPAPNTSREGPLLSQGSNKQGASKHSKIAHISFSLCFSESCTLFLLFMCQELNILDPGSRLLNWRISLFILLAMILFAIPLSQNFLLTYQSPLGRVSRSRSVPTRVLMALIPYSLYIFALSLIPLPEGLSSTSLISAALLRLIVLGTLIIGLLSGLGAARNAWDFTPWLSKNQRRVPSEQELLAAEEALERIRNDVQVRRKEERRLQESKSDDTSSWMSRVASTITGSSELTSIQREIAGLLALEYQMDRNLENLKSLHANSRYNRTLQGRVFQWVGRIFALYCVFRTLSSILNILAPYHARHSLNNDPHPRSSYPDLIAHLLTYMFSLLPFIHLGDESISVISRQVGLILVGVIILSSVRFVLRAVSRSLRITSQNLGASLLLLILAQLMGIYLISTLVQLRTAFPPVLDSASASSNVFSTLPAYEVFGAAFDYSYLLSAFATGAYLWIDERINGTGSKIDDN
ncbi:Abscisic acid G-protein coupled receptor-domain-containing protein [Phellopilus nigrolimitatus]|nr:Abscisic acid G-protein coupled receptor-domain-containing protein [Phellopilus nigrolimitatus]